MKLQRYALIVFLTLLAVSTQGQEGHPYKGTWRGTAVSGDMTIPIVIIMDYQNDQITGLINPGKYSYQFVNSVHDAEKWQLTVAAKTKQNEEIKMITVMREIGSPHRVQEGKWQLAGRDYALKLTRE